MKTSLYIQSYEIDPVDRIDPGLAGKEVEISKSKNLLHVLTGCEFSN